MHSGVAVTPSQLSGISFVTYPAEGQRFAAEDLSLLQRLPLIVCPSFLEQVPAEHDVSCGT